MRTRAVLAGLLMIVAVAGLMLMPTRTHESVFGQFRGFIRLGCTLGGSPGIFGVPNR